MGWCVVFCVVDYYLGGGLVVGFVGGFLFCLFVALCGVGYVVLCMVCVGICLFLVVVGWCALDWLCLWEIVFCFCLVVIVCGGRWFCVLLLCFGCCLVCCY